MVPNGHPVVSSALPTIQLDRLRAGVGEESKRLLDACRTHGFFYLDLQSDPILCRQWEDMLAVMKNYFEQPLEVKLKDARNSDNYGWAA
jgi:isopenicillin N synthase-like dioxygenase